MPGGSFWREEEGEAGLVTGGESQEGVGVEEGAVGPVSGKRRQEEMDKRPRKSAMCLRMCSLDTLQSF